MSSSGVSGASRCSGDPSGGRRESRQYLRRARRNVVVDVDTPVARAQRSEHFAWRSLPRRVPQILLRHRVDEPGDHPREMLRCTRSPASAAISERTSAVSRCLTELAQSLLELAGEQRLVKSSCKVRLRHQGRV